MFCFILVPPNMASQRHKEKQKKKLLQKASQNFLSAKAIFERIEPSTIYYKDFHSLDLQNDLQILPETIQPKERSN